MRKPLSYPKKYTPEQVKKIREKCKKDLYYLAKYILGYKDLGEFHRWLCDIVSKNQPKTRLFLLPRGHFKTSLVTIADTIRNILINPNIRVLVCMATQYNARKTLAEIKAHFTHNDTFRRFFGDYCPGAGKEFGSADKLTVPNRTQILKEPTVEAFGVGAKIVGAHYDIMKKDDLIDEKTILTPEQVNKIIEWDQLTIPLFENPEKGRTDYVATRFHYDDLSGHLINNRPDVKVWIRKVIENDNPVFPERFTKEGINKIRSEMGSSHFSAQYMNDPVASDNALFKPNMIRKWKNLPDKMYKVMAVDPALSEKKSDDHSAVIIAGMDTAGKIYVLRAYNLSVTPKELINRIYVAAYQFKPKKVALEAFGFQKALKFFIDAEAKRYKKRLPIVEVTGGRIRKSERIHGLQPFVERGDLLVHETQTDLIEQMLRYPMCKHDDLLDALSYCLEVLRKPSGAVNLHSKWNALERERTIYINTCPQAQTTGYY